MASSIAAAGTLTTALAPSVAVAGREPADGALVAAALAGDAAAVDALFQRHWPQAYRVALLIAHDHAAAEDIAQEAFVAAVGRLELFDRRRPFGPWLTKIAANRAIDWTRSRGRRREVLFDAAADPTPAGAGLVADAGSAGAAGRVATPAAAAGASASDPLSAELLAALAALPPDQRAVVVLRHLLEWTPGEIARALELPRGTVNSRLRRALDALRLALGEEAAP